MYVPAHFSEDRIDVLWQFMRASGLATLVSMTADGLIASHAPLLLDPDPAPYGTLIGHLAKANPHARAADPGIQTLVVFQGPDGYITPSYYAAKQEHGKVVPTWNYAAIHAYGVLEAFDDPVRLLEVVTRLTDRHEVRSGATLGRLRRAARIRHGNAARHRRHRTADRAPGGQGENEPEPAGGGPDRGCRRAAARRPGRPGPGGGQGNQPIEGHRFGLDAADAGRRGRVSGSSDRSSRLVKEAAR